jgi:mono/diheme cytochrome c family protein
MLCALALGAALALGCNSDANGPNTPLSPQQGQGRRIFQARCAQCHEAYSTGPRSGPGLKGMFRKQYLPSGAPANDERVRVAIQMGRVNMPPFGRVLDDQQMDDLLAFLHTL